MSSRNLAVEVEGLSKRYLISHQEQHAYLSTAIMDKLRHPFAKPEKEEFWAVRDVSFEVEQGDVLGVIGRNGAGKSTLLKILSQIVEPTMGEVRMHGRVGSLLEVGTGFHPELTGRENIFLNGTILGMRKREVQSHFDEIVDFAEVEQFIDTPVKRYSSGMYVRLAFAVAAHLEPEILIVDEVLAVGDAQFQAKCLGKMQDISKGHGRTILFVSHNVGAVQTLCTKAAMMRQGRLAFFGDVETAVEMYSEKPKKITGGRIVDQAVVDNEGIVLDSITVNGSDATTLELDSEQTTLDVVVKGRALRAIRAGIEFRFRDANGMPLGFMGESFPTRTTPDTEAGPFEWRARLELPRKMSQGTYSLGIDVADYMVFYWVRIEEAVEIHYEGAKPQQGDPFRYKEEGLLMLDGTVSRSTLSSTGKDRTCLECLPFDSLDSETCDRPHQSSTSARESAAVLRSRTYRGRGAATSMSPPRVQRIAKVESTL